MFGVNQGRLRCSAARRCTLGTQQEAHRTLFFEKIEVSATAHVTSGSRVCERHSAFGQSEPFCGCALGPSSTRDSPHRLDAFDARVNGATTALRRSARTRAHSRSPKRAPLTRASDRGQAELSCPLKWTRPSTSAVFNRTRGRSYSNLIIRRVVATRSRDTTSSNVCSVTRLREMARQP